MLIRVGLGAQVQARFSSKLFQKTLNNDYYITSLIYFLSQNEK